MKRCLVAVAVALVAIAGFNVAQAADRSAAVKVTICHKTKSAKNPYVRITVRDRATLNGHVAHPGDIIPAPAGGCPHSLLTSTRGGRALHATLTGAAEVPGPGDSDGSGMATIRLRLGQGQLCFLLNVAKITLPAVAAHVHTGPAGVAGAVLVTLAPPDATGQASGCVTVPRDTIKAILTNPAGYYANVHTTDFPAGAIRGQLA